jgi:hypothetical protein
MASNTIEGLMAEKAQMEKQLESASKRILKQTARIAILNDAINQLIASSALSDLGVSDR